MSACLSTRCASHEVFTWSFAVAEHDQNVFSVDVESMMGSAACERKPVLDAAYAMTLSSSVDQPRNASCF